MNILKDFDAAIAGTEDTPRGYCVGQHNYDNYMSNNAWAEYLARMSAEHRSQYGDGSGGELREKDGRPPKMAAFASSSRMIYLLSRDISGFAFEKQLPTVIGGIANMDGYQESDNQYTFVESKCREPYSHKSPQTIKLNYRPLYAYLQDKAPELFSCTMEDGSDTRDMRVIFFCRGKEVVHFDIKQMLCHLLGVANNMLAGGNCDTPVRFLYLLYNPTDLVLPQKSRERILRIYRDTCATAEDYDFKRIFGYVVDFLMQKKKYAVSQESVTKLKKGFCFALCDQNSYRSYFG